MTLGTPIVEFQKLDAAKAQTKLLDLRREQMNLRFQQAAGQLENPNRIRAVRKDIARLKTVLNTLKRQEKQGS